MKDSFSSRQWWRLPPVIVISLIAAVALLFLSGRAAVMAFAEGEDDITISFHANGASGSPPASITVEKGETFTLPFDSGGMTKEGYSLVRWSVTPDGSTNTWSLGSQECFYEDTVLYAIWGKDISVTYDPNGGTDTPPASVTGQPYLNVTIASADTLSKAGAEFIHWNTAADDSGTYYLPGWSESFGEDVVLYAIWKDTITVSYDLNGGTGTPTASVTGIPELYIKTPPEPEREGYRFMNWNTSPDGSGDDYGAERYYYFSETVCLYAFWYQLPTVTLSYDANGGTGPVPGET